MYKADAETVELYKEWIGLKNTILSYYSSPLEDQKDDKVNLSDLEKQANEAEKQLSKRSARFSDVFSGKQLGYDDLRAGLQPGDAAMEIVRISNPFDRNNGTVAYVGLIARKDAVYPEMAKISNGKDLEEKSIKLYRSYIKYSKDKDKADDKAYRAFWEPFDKRSANANHCCYRWTACTTMSVLAPSPGPTALTSSMHIPFTRQAIPGTLQ